MLDVHEVTLAGFDGSTDDTDALVLWVAGDASEIAAAIEGTGAVLNGTVDAEPHEADYRLPDATDRLRAAAEAARDASASRGMAP